MSKSNGWSSLALAIASSLLLVAVTAAQGDPERTSPEPSAVLVPELEGLVWYRTTDLGGSEIEATRDADEVAEWTKLAEGVDASLAELEYTYQVAFDPADLPDQPAIATVRVPDAETSALHAAVVQDIVNQVVNLGEEAPKPVADTIAGKQVTVVGLPEQLGLDDAIVFATGDMAYVFLMARDLAEQALGQLP